VSSVESFRTLAIIKYESKRVLVNISASSENPFLQRLITTPCVLKPFARIKAAIPSFSVSIGGLDLIIFSVIDLKL